VVLRKNSPPPLKQTTQLFVSLSGWFPLLSTRVRVRTQARVGEEEERCRALGLGGTARHRGCYAEGAAAEEEAEHRAENPQKCTGGKLVRPLASQSDANPNCSE